MIRVGIFGATGYAGLELVRILWRHPVVEIAFATSTSQAGGRLSDIHPQAPDFPLIAPDQAPLDAIDCALLCLPHAASAEQAIRALDAGRRVIDLSADFRLRDPAVYRRWYAHEHPAPELLDEAVYGLTEQARDRLPGARLVANPGCYATSILLPLLPLVSAGALRGPIIADSKSGVSGAGRTPQAHTHFVEVYENFSAYNVGRSHRHLPEMEQALAGWGGAGAPSLIFSPHLLPVRRGILSTLYAGLAPGWSPGRARERLAAAWADEPFLRLLPEGRLPSLMHVVRSNGCVLGMAEAGPDQLILVSVLDNLVKGAAGQAVQNLNAMFGLDETIGLERPELSA
ncbi:MAG: N-acetyl-gamma-glutamyl-phosphate reductase [Caldilineae bacterium]|nr:N-acetyl-gamma-glutamyl-phosphate reductase [Caldilineae bacterium]